MDNYSATETAYKNGYDRGKKETANNIADWIAHRAENSEFSKLLKELSETIKNTYNEGNLL